MIESNLRKLFVEKRVVLPTIEETIPEPGKVEIQTTPGIAGRSVLFFKRPEETVYIIGEEGENILAVQKPRHVVLPLAQYTGDPEYIEAAIQDRLQAILDAVVANPIGLNEGPPTVVPAAQMTAFLDERLGRGKLSALITNSKNRDTIIQATQNWNFLGVPFFSYKDSLPANVVYGIAKPEYVGYIITDASPKVQPDEAFVGILCHGGVVAAQLKP